MRAHTPKPAAPVTELPDHPNRRHCNRTPVLFSLLYSGMSSGQMLIGNGVATNLSSRGIGIRGNRSVTQGMDVALFVDLPGVEDPLCIARSQVSWVAGSRFGVTWGTLSLEEKKHMQFLMGDCHSPSDSNCDI